MPDSLRSEPPPTLPQPTRSPETSRAPRGLLTSNIAGKRPVHRSKLQFVRAPRHTVASRWEPAAGSPKVHPSDHERDPAEADNRHTDRSPS